MFRCRTINGQLVDFYNFFSPSVQFSPVFRISVICQSIALLRWIDTKLSIPLMDWNNEKRHSGIDGLTKFRQLAGIKMEWNKDWPTLFLSKPNKRNYFERWLKVYKNIICTATCSHDHLSFWQLVRLTATCCGNLPAYRHKCVATCPLTVINVWQLARLLS